MEPTPYRTTTLQDFSSESTRRVSGAYMMSRPSASRHCSMTASSVRQFSQGNDGAISRSTPRSISMEPWSQSATFTDLFRCHHSIRFLARSAVARSSVRDLMQRRDHSVTHLARAHLFRVPGSKMSAVR